MRSVTRQTNRTSIEAAGHERPRGHGGGVHYLTEISLLMTEPCLHALLLLLLLEHIMKINVVHSTDPL